MFGILRFSAAATLAEVVRAIQRTPARRIALVFPSGAQVSLAELGRMGVVDLLCREQRKEATIIGGDARLRACAVACGLRAAVTVEDWRAMRTPRGAWISWRKPRPTVPVQLTLLPSAASQGASLAPGNPNSADDENDQDESDPRDDLPDYIRELLALQGHGAPAETHGPRLHSLTPPRQTTIAYDLDRDDDVRELWESDEEQLTETIRSSSGLSRTVLASQWRMARMSAPDGASN